MAARTTGVGYARPGASCRSETLLRCRRPPTCSTPASKVAILVGAGGLGGDGRADRGGRPAAGAGVAKALLGKAALPDDLPWVTGSIGLLGTKPSWDMMQGCDTLPDGGLGSFPYSEFLPRPGSARGVQIDIDGAMLSLRYPMEINMVGDSAVPRSRRCCRC